jgi:hypothetical protein
MMSDLQLNENWGAWFSTHAWDLVITSEIQRDNWYENQDDSHPIPKNNSTLVLIPISWAFMIRYQIANLSSDFFLSII